MKQHDTISERADGVQRYSRLAAATVAIFALPAQAFAALAVAGGSPAEGTPSRDSEALGEVDVVITEVMVLGRGYENDVTGAKALTPIKETPSSVTLISAERIEAQGLITMEDALNKTAGITAQKIVSSYPKFFARGFEVTSYLLDGVPAPGFGQPPYGVPDLFLFDRIEYLRGPASLFSGSGSPGGSINLVRKRPKSEFSASTSLTGGSWGFLRAEGDLSAPLNDSGTIRSRVGALYQNADYYIDTVKRDRAAAFIALDFDLGQNTTLSLGGFFDDYESSITVGLPTHAVDGLIDFPVDTMIGSDANAFRTKHTHGFAELSHAFNGSWRMRVSAQYNDLSKDERYLFAASGVPVDDVNNGVLEMWGFLGDQSADGKSADASVVGQFDLFGRTHGVIVGADYQKSVWNYRENFTIPSLFGDPILIDVFNPVPRPQFPDISLDSSSSGFFDQGDTITEQYGAYFQTRLKLAEPLTAVLGGRVGWVDYSSNGIGGIYGAYSVKSKLAPYVGVVYDLTPAWSLYGSFTEAFQPQIASDRNGNPIGPLSGEQYEAGVKGNPISDRLLLSAAVFRLEQSNRAVADPADPTASIASGVVRAEGFEVEINGQITREWAVNGGYYYTENEVISDPLPSAVGVQFAPIIPKHNFRLFSNYDFDQGSVLGRFSVGGGVEYNSERRVDDIIRQGGYVVVDLRAGYDLTDNVNLAVNLNNVFDKKYYYSLFNSTFGNVYGEPRSVFMTLRAKL